jgi:hypothetical protein
MMSPTIRLVIGAMRVTLAWNKSLWRLLHHEDGAGNVDVYDEAHNTVLACIHNCLAQQIIDEHNAILLLGYVGLQAVNAVPGYIEESRMRSQEKP